MSVLFFWTNHPREVMPGERNKCLQRLNNLQGGSQTSSTYTNRCMSAHTHARSTHTHISTFLLTLKCTWPPNCVCSVQDAVLIVNAVSSLDIQCEQSPPPPRPPFSSRSCFRLLPEVCGTSSTLGLGDSSAWSFRGISMMVQSRRICQLSTCFCWDTFSTNFHTSVRKRHTCTTHIHACMQYAHTTRAAQPLEWLFKIYAKVLLSSPEFSFIYVALHIPGSVTPLRSSRFCCLDNPVGLMSDLEITATLLLVNKSDFWI